MACHDDSTINIDSVIIIIIISTDTERRAGDPSAIAEPLVIPRILMFGQRDLTPGNVDRGAR